LRLVQPKDRQSSNELFRRALGGSSVSNVAMGLGGIRQKRQQLLVEDMQLRSNAILDPTCSDLTARMLELLGIFGLIAEQVRSRRH